MILEDILFAAREHAASLLNDVELASTREEHIRLTARANEAENLVADLQTLYLAQVTDE
jgi:phosphotransferase system HPr-like phosphotransfer protein